MLSVTALLIGVCRGHSSELGSVAVKRGAVGVIIGIAGVAEQDVDQICHGGRSLALIEHGQRPERCDGRATGPQLRQSIQNPARRSEVPDVAVARRLLDQRPVAVRLSQPGANCLVIQRNCPRGVTQAVIGARELEDQSRI